MPTNDDPKIPEETQPDTLEVSVAEEIKSADVFGQ
jgi:hypothetical protein